MGGTKVGPRFQRMLPWPAYSSDEDGDMRPQKILKMAETRLKWLLNAGFFLHAEKYKNYDALQRCGGWGGDALSPFSNSFPRKRD